MIAAGLAAAASAAPVATFTYPHVDVYADPDPLVTKSETVATSQAVGSVVISGGLLSMVETTWGSDVAINVAAPDGQAISLVPFPDASSFSGYVLDPTSVIFPTPVASAAGVWTFEFLDTYGDGDIGLPDARWDWVTIVLESDGINDPPPCPDVLAHTTLTGVTSDTLQGQGGANSIVTRHLNAGVAVNTIRLSGQVVATPPSLLSEVRVNVTGPSGRAYALPPLGLPARPGIANLDFFEYILPQGEVGEGDWTIEFAESLDDDISPDATWTSVCVGVFPTPTGLNVSAITDPPFVVNTGGTSGHGTFVATVVPGEFPTSSFHSTGSVVVDASSIGLGTITLRDDGVPPDAVADNMVFTGAYTIPPGATTGDFWLWVTAIDDQGRDRTSWLRAVIAGPAPGCPGGVETFSTTNAVSNDPVGGAGNTRRSFTVATDTPINLIRLTGRTFAFEPSFVSDARIRLTAPSGTNYYLTPITGFAYGLADVTNYVLDIGHAINARGNWTVEFYERYSDSGISPDSIWPAACITLDAQGACCIGGACSIRTIADCQAAGGVFFGAATDCAMPFFEVAPSTSQFEDISAVGTLLNNSNANDAISGATISFPFNYLGINYNNVFVSSNGNIQFTSSSASHTNLPFPNVDAPNNMIAPLWDDLNAQTRGDIYAYNDLSGGFGNRRFIVSWQNIAQDLQNDSNSFQVVLYQNGSFEFRYGTITPEAFRGDYSVGFESIDGSYGLDIPGTDLGTGNTDLRFIPVAEFNPCDSNLLCPDCAADFDQDGGVTPSDIGAFFAQYEMGHVCADVDEDGGVTGADIAAFFVVFETGGC